MQVLDYCGLIQRLSSAGGKLISVPSGKVHYEACWEEQFRKVFLYDAVKQFGAPKPHFIAAAMWNNAKLSLTRPVRKGTNGLISALSFKAEYFRLRRQVYDRLPYHTPALFRAAF